MEQLIWKFRTANFVVKVVAIDENEPDLSFDETGETQAKVASGEWTVFCAKASVSFRGEEIASDYLGNCIYADLNDFRDHVGLASKSRADGCNYGSYFADMVANVIKEARDHYANVPKLRATAR